MKFSRVVLSLFIATALLIQSASLSHAGGGSDGVVELTWKNWPKDMAKKCNKQKFIVRGPSNIDWSDPLGGMFVQVYLYNSNDQVIAERIVLSKRPDTSGLLQFCDPLGRGPYYIDVEWNIGRSSNLQSGEFSIPYKFKKKKKT